MSPDLAALLADLEKALAEIAPDEATDLIGALRRLEVKVEGRMVEAKILSALTANGQSPAAKAEDRWLTPKEAAEFLGLTAAQLNRLRNLPRKKLGHRTIRYSLTGLRRHMARA